MRMKVNPERRNQLFLAVPRCVWPARLSLLWEFSGLFFEKLPIMPGNRPGSGQGGWGGGGGERVGAGND